MDNLLTTYCNQHDGLIISSDTVRESDLLFRFANSLLDFSDDEKHEEIATEALKVLEQYGDFGYIYYCAEMLEETKDRVWWLVYEGLCNALISIAPKGFYFGCSEGDGACVGFFKISDSDF